jgi:polar amino acid transport system permease protein
LVTWPHPFDLLPVLLQGARVTLEVTLMAAGVALVLSFVVGLARLAPFHPVRFLATVYVEILRGTSALVQLFYLFFILPAFGIRLDPMTTAVIGLGLNLSAYGSEIVRAAVRHVDHGQWEASVALSMSPALALRRIILPQALLAMMPPFGNLLIELLKATSLVSLITLTDLTFAGSTMVASTGRAAQVWGLVLLIYLVMALPLGWLVRRLEARLSVYRLPVKT